MVIIYMMARILALATYVSNSPCLLIKPQDKVGKLTYNDSWAIFLPIGAFLVFGKSKYTGYSLNETTLHR